MAPKIGTVGLWTAEAQEGRCARCDAQFRKAIVDQKLERDRRERENRRKREIVTILGGIKPFEEFTFERFDIVRNASAAPAYAAAMVFDPERDNLFLYGKNNLGKTHLATAVAHKFLDKNIPVRFYDMPELVETLRIFEGQHDYAKAKQFVRKLIEAPVFVLDDLGVVGATPFVVEVLWKILTGRINAGRNGAVITSNDTLNDLNAKYGGKIPHRIHRLCGDLNEIRFAGSK